MMKILRYSVDSYLRNLKLILFFSIPLLIAFLIPIYVQMPSFLALGGIYLRTGSIPDMTYVDAGIMILSFMVSLFLISFAIVDINLIVKSERTTLKIRKEVIDGIGKYTVHVFWIFLTVELVLLIIQLIALEYGIQEIASPILSFIVFLPVFYAPAALVIDDLRPWRALEKSVSMIFSKFFYFMIWLLIGFVLLSFFDLVLLSLFPTGVGSLLMLAVNSIFILPYLVVLQTQMYMTKYTILA